MLQTNIILRLILYLVYLCPCVGLSQFMWDLCDMFFIFILIFIAINQITSLLLFLHFLECLLLFLHDKWAYIKYVGRGVGGFYKFFKKYFVAQGTTELNILWLSNFIEQNSMAPPNSFIFLFNPWLSEYFRVSFTEIFKALKELIFKIMFQQ